MFNWPWGMPGVLDTVPLPEEYRSRFNSEYGPDRWACKFLDDWGKDLRANPFDGKRAVKALRYAIKSGHGIGKSVMVAWIIKFILDTRPMSHGTVTATTADQLKARTWAELGKWHRLSQTAGWFNYQDTRGNMVLKHRKFGMEWFCQGVTCKAENATAFQGQHAANSTSFYVFDEASGVPDPIFEAREGGLSDGQPMVFDFGNPNFNTGYFYENCRGKYRFDEHGNKRIDVRSVDSREVYITQKDKLNEDIGIYGIDSDFIKVRILGEFPSAGDLQFIPSADVLLAQTRPLSENRLFPRTIGVDCGGTGSNPDETVIYSVKGMDARSFPPVRMKGWDQTQIANAVIQEFLKFAALGDPVTMIFVDSTGGYGGGVVSQLRALGYPVIEVGFGLRATDNRHYKYTVDELWGKGKQAIKDGLCLPGSDTQDGDDIFAQLTQRQFGYTLSDQIRLETKDDMKARGISSPDIADALFLNFYMPVALRNGLPQNAGMQITEYDPYANVRAD
jgi:hypothetical protein